MVLLIVLVAALLLAFGFEMFLVLGVPAVLTRDLLFARMPDIVLVQKLIAGVNHSTLLAIPFFIFAAELMASGQIASRLTDLIKSLCGGLRGGVGHTTIGGCMAFGSVSGSAPATVAALGKLMYPELRAAGYSEKFTLGLIISSAETALLIPPSITLIIYGWMTGTSVGGLFIGGLAVGATMGLAFAGLVAWESVRKGVGRAPRASTVLAALRNALWALGLPVIILGGIYSGFFTPTEAAAVSVLYAIAVEAFVHRSLGWKRLFQVTERSAISTAIIFILLAVGSVLAHFITLAHVPRLITDFLTQIDAGPVLFLAIVNVAFLIAGMFIDPNSTQLILVPTLFPVAQAMGIDAIHFGLVVCLNICIGMITPPFGLDIFVASSTLNKPVMAIIKGVWPFLFVNLLVLVFVTYVPDVATFLPRLLLK
ncbi:MAG: TRAP transporter large permease [Desulfovibrionaceae bacterium]|jgi:C4-dicarboxylate transporter DctM subunit|nr:TRAP transporter large permease [Desulfovibrionaceae bacterium]